MPVSHRSSPLLTPEQVVVAVALDLVVAGVAADRVVAVAAECLVVACLERDLVGAVVAVHFVVGSDRVRLGRLPGDRRCARIDPVVAEHDVVGVTGEQLVLAEAAVHRVDPPLRNARASRAAVRHDEALA